MKKTALICAALLLAAPQAFAMDTFSQAKKEMPAIYKQLDNVKSVYCGCPVSVNKNNRFRVDLESCGYQVRKNEKRARRVEMEHLMPAWAFGHQLQCWQNGGRKNCTSTNKEFNTMEGDLHNLVPAVGEVNGDRSNFRFSQWNETPSQYGKCEMIIDFKRKQANPPERARGIIARAHKYMEGRYKIKLSSSQKKLFDAWDNMYPPDANECKRNQLIARVQGNDNPFITAKCQQ